MEDDPDSGDLLLEAGEKHRLTRPLIQVRATLFMEPDTFVPDALTRIRVLETVASVTQDRDYFARTSPEALTAVDASLQTALPSKVDPLRGSVSTTGREMVNVLIRFLPNTVTVGEAIKEIASRLRTVPGVRKVQFDELNGRPLTVGGKPVVF